jgi:tRNA-modifying protein YgfZ
VGVSGPEASSYLERMLSNEVATLAVGASCDALLLTAKGRVIAPMTVLRRGPDDFLLLTEPELGERLREELLRGRFAAKAAIELEAHASVLVVGREAPPGTVANRDYGMPAYELLDESPPDWAEIDEEELERLRIHARTPRFGREVDERVLPAEAGLDERAISFTKGCYPGQEPVARLRHRGHANRTLRVLAVEGEELPAYDEELTHEGKPVGRVTSAVRDPETGVVALGYVRQEVPPEAELRLGSQAVRQLTPTS